MTNKDFTTYEQASALKELGFNEPCIYAWCNKGGWNKYQMVKEPIVQVLRTDGNPFGQYFNGKNWNAEFSQNKNKIQCSAPTYSQAFRWFRDNYKLHSYIEGAYPWFRYYINSNDDRWEGFKHLIFEEAEAKCLDRLIQIVKEYGKQ